MPDLVLWRVVLRVVDDRHAFASEAWLVLDRYRPTLAEALELLSRSGVEVDLPLQPPPRPRGLIPRREG